MNISGSFESAAQFAARMANFAVTFPTNMDKFQDRKAEELLALVIKHASGRPGPNIVTGLYVSRFRLVDRRVVNDSPQTYRLEYGFVGVDSLGRVYHQPPFPHFRPALAEMRATYRGDMVQVIKETWKQS